MAIGVQQTVSSSGASTTGELKILTHGKLGIISFSRVSATMPYPTTIDSTYSHMHKSTTTGVNMLYLKYQYASKNNYYRSSVVDFTGWKYICVYGKEVNTSYTSKLVGSVSSTDGSVKIRIYFGILTDISAMGSKSGYINLAALRTSDVNAEWSIEGIYLVKEPTNSTSISTA